MTTERLEEFAVLANISNYSRAAEKLFLSQSVLSRHISELEKELGCKLFIRNTHKVELTDEGRYFLKWIRPFLKKADHLSSVILKESVRAEMQIRILCADQSLSSQLLSFIRKYKELHPEVRIDISHVRSRQKREMIYSNDIFISPCDFLNILKPDTEGLLLKTQQPLLAIPTLHHLSNAQEIRLEDLRGETLIVPYMDDILGPYNRNALAATKKCQGFLQKLSAENDQEGLLMAELGYGVMLFPYNMKDRIYPGTTAIPVSDTDCIFPIYCYLNRLTPHAAALDFYKNLCDELCAE